VRTLGIIGTGPQADGHVEAMLAVRPALDDIVVASRSTESAAATVARIVQLPCVTGSIRVRAGTNAEAATCDVLCTATRCIDPIVTAAMVRPGTHINAIGAYRTDMRELATDLVAACTVAVDDVQAAHDEAGDLALAVADGGWSWDRLAGDLTALSSGALRRHSDTEITLFKSVGLAVEDLVIARIVAASENLLP